MSARAEAAPDGAAPIFVTVGTQLAFPRLLDAANALAPDLGRPVIAQAGPDAAQAARWPNLRIEGVLDGRAFAALAGRAHLIVAHAGMGTILTARALGKPLILVPRRAEAGEHRNDHQVATCRHLEGRAGLAVAWDMDDLGRLIADPPPAPAPERGGPGEDVPEPLRALRARVRGFVEGA